MRAELSDAELVIATRRGERDALAELYDRYFPPLYDFLARMLRDRDAAADVAQDSFVKAIERLGQLRKPARFKSWLFSIGYRLGLDHAGERTAARPTQPDDPVLAEVDTSALGDPARAAGVAETGRFVWEMAAGLDPRSYTVMHLHVRMGLASAEIADVLGVTKGNAYTMVSRMKSTLVETIGAYLLLRQGTEACDELSALAAGLEFPPVTREIRKLVDRHARSCSTCADTRAALLQPSEVFGALVMVPLPVDLFGAVLGAASAAAASGAAGAAAGTGSSASGVVNVVRSNPATAAGVAAAVALAAILAAFQLGGDGEQPAEAADVLGVTLEQSGGGDDAPLAAPAEPGSPSEPAPADTTTSTTSTAPSPAADPPASTTTAPSPAPGTGTPAAPTSTTAPKLSVPPTTAPATTTTRPAPGTTTTVPPSTTTTTAPPGTSPPSSTTTTTAPAATTTTTTTPPPPPPTTTTTTTQPPPPAVNPPDLGSGSHPIGVPSTNPVITVRWTPVDGSQGYSITWSGDPAGSPDFVVDLPGSAGSATSPALQPGTWYFHLRTQGAAGDWAATATIGPFVIVPPPSPPVVAAVVAAPPTISEMGCTPAAATVVATGVADPDGDVASAVLSWAIGGAGSGSLPMNLRGSTAEATLSFPSDAIGPVGSPATVTLQATIADATGLTASASTTLLLLDCA